MNILPRLRAECAANHRALEERLDIQRWLNSPSMYRQLLERFWGIYFPIEPRLERAMEGFPWPLSWEERRKVPLLEADLRALGASGDAGKMSAPQKADLRALGASDEEIADLPVCGDFLEIDTPQRALGVLYVVEGSTLGGQFISKMILKRLGLGPENGAAFFNGYGANTGAMWKQFGEALTAAVGEDEQDEVVAAAKETFGCFEDWLCGEGVAVAGRSDGVME